MNTSIRKFGNCSILAQRRLEVKKSLYSAKISSTRNYVSVKVKNPGDYS